MIIPIPKHDVQEVYIPPDTDRIEWYLNVPPWKCKKCGLTNFGRNEKCADYTCREVRNESTR